MKKTAFILFVCIFSQALRAQDVQFKASAPKYVKTGERFNIKYSVDGTPQNFTPPSFTGFSVYGGPMSGQSHSTVYDNGKVTSVTEYSYTYTLSCNKPGKYTIDAASANVNGKTAYSNKLTIEVVGSQTSVPDDKSTSSASVSSSGDNVFIRLVLDKKNVYVGEQITAYVKLYSKISLTNYDHMFEMPEFTGFYKRDIETAKLRSLQREKVGNEIYAVGTVRKVILYPQKTGNITIPSFSMDVEVEKQFSRPPRSHYERMQRMMEPSEVITLISKPVVVKVKSLPDEPNNYTGAVGNFEVNSSIDKNSLKTNDALSYKITVNGTGNIKLLENLDFEFPSTFEVFDPVVNTSLNESNMFRSGTKTYEYTLIPRHAGKFKIPSYAFVYFDPGSKKYITKNTDEYIIDVKKGEGDTISGAVVVNAIPNKENIELLESDIKFIQRKTVLKEKGVYIFGTKIFYYLYLVPFVLFVIALFIQRRRIKQNADIAKVKNRKANHVARKRLRMAGSMIKLNKQNEFYEEILKAIWEYLSDKLFIPVSGLSKENALKQLKLKNIDEEILKELSEIIDLSEFARYAPSTEAADMKELYTRTSKVIAKLAQRI